MSDAKAPQEPSMEEILASIRRIISEDSDGAKGEAPAAPVAAPAPPPMPASFSSSLELDSALELDSSMQLEDDDVLDLTQRADPMGDFGSPSSEADSLFDFEQESDIDADEMHVPEVDFSEGLMSRASANAAEDAFARLASLEDAMPMAPPIQTSASVDGVLEVLVKDALKPVLKQWLDDHLPPMVEELVRTEIQRLAQANRRK